VVCSSPALKEAREAGPFLMPMDGKLRAYGWLSLSDLHTTLTWTKRRPSHITNCGVAWSVACGRAT
jgi:hypothetical protein